jgi:murein DD-endopeptidase MepM/ murein hydrolase activator NlpD
MDKRLFDKSSNFFKKEGFYVVLFICLCVVATVAAVTARNNRIKDNKPPVVQEEKNGEVALNTGNNAEVIVNNALEVKRPTEPSKVVSVPREGSSAVSKTVDTKFAKPVDGTLARKYTTDLVYCETIGTYKTNHGMEIKAELGTSVKAVLDGKVELVDNDQTTLGKYVIINHQNGLKTVYANLDENVTVKVGDTVKKGKVIGKVGNTRESYSEEKFGDHLHFEVMKGKDYADPSRYVTYVTSSK